MIEIFEAFYRYGAISAAPDVFLNLMIKGTLILTAAGLLYLVLRHSSAAMRHWIWSLAFYGLLALPVLSAVLPEKALPLLPDADGIQEYFSQSAIGEYLQESPEERKAAEQALWKEKNAQEIPTIVPLTLAEKIYLKDYAKMGNMLNFSIPWIRVFFFLWLAGSVLLIFHIVYEILAIHWFSYRGKAIEDQEWLDLLAHCKRTLNVNRPVEIITSNITLPMTFGLFRPKILIPAAAASWSQKQRQVVLLHELAHIDRWDYLTNLVEQLAVAVYWCNPLVWIGVRQLRIQREQACDDCVLREGTSQVDYATHLLEIVKALPYVRRVERRAVAMANHRELKKRLQYIVTHKIPRHSVQSNVAVYSGIFSVAAILMLGMVHFEGKPDLGNTSDWESPPPKVLSQDGMILGLTSQNPQVKRKSAWMLGQQIDARAVEPLINLLKDDNCGVRAMSAWALGEIGDQRAASQLISTIEDRDAYVREMAIESIGKLKVEHAVPALEEMLADPAVNIRLITLQALNEIGNPAAMKALKVALDDTSAEVRETAVCMLGSSGQNDKDEILRNALNDPDANVRWLATKKLSDIYERHSVYYFVNALSDHSPVVRKKAVEALAKTKDVRAISPLRNSLQDEDPDVRQAAVRALDQMKSPDNT